MVCGERDLDNRVRGHTQLREGFGALDGCQDVLTPKVSVVTRGDTPLTSPFSIIRRMVAEMVFPRAATLLV